MFNNGGCYSLADIAAATGNNNNGWGGDGAWWIILLFLFAGGWGNGYGYGGGGNGTVREEVSYGFDMNGLENGIRGIQQGLCDGFYAMNTSMLNGFSGVQNSLCQGFAGVTAGMNASTNALMGQLAGMAADNAACCCETQRAIERGFADLGYNLATQECQTRQAVTDATKGILDFLTQDKIAALTAENQTLKFAASQQAQNAYLVNELGPKYPVPAYTVPNPFANYNYNNCCNGC